jgi:VWFA-related protein
MNSSFWKIILSISLLLQGFPTEIISQEEHEVEVRLVLVDVIVTKDGKFVKDLTREDFTLYEDGKKVSINSFELINFEKRELKIQEEKEETKELALPKKKLIVIFDGINAWNRDLSEQKEKIINELIFLIKLGHKVMITQLNLDKGLEVIMPFSSNEELIINSIEKSAGNIWNLGADVGTIPPTEEELGGHAKSQADPRFYKNMMRMDYLLKERRKFANTIGGILGVFNMTKDLPGRKSILLISGGIPDISPSDTLPRFGQDADDPMSKYWGKAANDAAAKRNQLYNIDNNIRIFDPFNILRKNAF